MHYYLTRSLFNNNLSKNTKNMCMEINIINVNAFKNVSLFREEQKIAKETNKMSYYVCRRMTRVFPKQKNQTNSKPYYVS